MSKDEVHPGEGDRSRVRELFPEVNEIQDPALAQEVVDIWVEAWKASPWERLEEVPKNPETVSADHKLVTHVRSVTRQAMALARSVQQFHGIQVNMDLLIAGGLLHDVSKLMEYSPGELGAEKSRFGELIQHGSYAVHKALAHGLPLELVHLLGSHTMQSRVAPSTLEAILLFYADCADSDALLWQAGRGLLLQRSFR